MITDFVYFTYRFNSPNLSKIRHLIINDLSHILLDFVSLLINGIIDQVSSYVYWFRLIANILLFMIYVENI